MKTAITIATMAFVFWVMADTMEKVGIAAKAPPYKAVQVVALVR